MVKAYALTTIHRRIDGKKDVVEASTKQRISIFETTSEELEKLVAVGAARKATTEEVAIAKAKSGETDAPTNVEKQIAAQEAKPASGAEGDPQGKPKGAAKAASKDEEI
ncbi:MULTISPECIES: hypothetical protein [unclassified Agrobacterium]